MKQTLLIFLILLGFQASSQVMYIQNATTTTVSGGINVHLETITGHGAGFISNSYTVTGNVIELDVCYWYDNTLPILTFTHDFFIPLSTIQEYTINVHIMMSQSTEVCDNSANPANLTVEYDFMSTDLFDADNTFKLFPNPTTGIINFSGLDAKINRIKIYDIAGKLIKSQTDFSNNKLDLSLFQNGIYIIQIYTDQRILNEKIIIQK